MINLFHTNLFYFLDSNARVTIETLSTKVQKKVNQHLLNRFGMWFIFANFKIMDERKR